MKKVKLADIGGKLPISGLEFELADPRFKEEEYVGRIVEKNPKTTLYEMLTHFLSTVLVKLGDKSFETENGRSYKKAYKALLELREKDVLTMYTWLQYKIDNEYKQKYECDSCGTDVENTFDIGELIIKFVETDEDRFADVRLKFGMGLSDTDLKQNIVVTYPLWSYAVMHKSLTGARRSMIRHCIVSIDGNPDFPIGEKMLESLYTVDRRRIAQGVESLEGGPVFRFETDCPCCSNTGEWEYTPLESFDFF